jgi:hypothetical protein
MVAAEAGIDFGIGICRRSPVFNWQWLTVPASFQLARKPRARGIRINWIESKQHATKLEQVTGTEI